MTLTARNRIARLLRAAAPPASIALAVAVLLRFPPAQNSFYPQCPFYGAFHLLCPGCGATRAMAALLRGHFAEAMHFNALIILMLPVATVYGMPFYYSFLKRKPLRRHQPPSAAIYAALAMAIVFTAVRNLPLRPF